MRNKISASGIRLNASRGPEQRSGVREPYPSEDSGLQRNDAAENPERTVFMAALARGERGSAAPAQVRPGTHAKP
jgi:hypothetical protein